MAKRSRPTLTAECADFIHSTPTPFHLCAVSAVRLKAAGFQELQEDDPTWIGEVSPGGKYFYTRNRSTLVAFTVGTDFVAGNGFNVVGAHTDSPVLKLKPSSKKTAHGYQQLNVEAYGGGLWHTWFDRELTLAGCVIVREADGTFAKRLVHIGRPILRIPSLCIHLQSAEERAAFAPNKETHLAPIIALVKDALGEPAAPAAAAEPADGTNGFEIVPPPSKDERHAPELLVLLGKELGVEPSAICDFELSLCDTQPPQVWGLNDEFLSSPRLDNQVCARHPLPPRRAATPPAPARRRVVWKAEQQPTPPPSYCGWRTAAPHQPSASPSPTPPSRASPRAGALLHRAQGARRACLRDGARGLGVWRHDRGGDDRVLRPRGGVRDL